MKDSQKYNILLNLNLCGILVYLQQVKITVAIVYTETSDFYGKGFREKNEKEWIIDISLLD